MKRAFSLLLCIGLIFSMTGCRQNNSPAAREKRITQQLIDAKYLQGTVNGSIGMDMDTMGHQSLNINGNFQSDISAGYPKLKLDGTISLGELMSMPLGLYMDEKNWSITLFGQTQSHDISEDQKGQYRTVVEQISANQATLARTVKETTKNEQSAFEIHYDVNQLNALLTMSGNENSSVEQLTMYYILKDDDNVSQIDMYMTGNFPKHIETAITFIPTSVGEAFEINQ